MGFTMNTLIDWMSFSVVIGESEVRSFAALTDELHAALIALHPKMVKWLGLDDGIVMTKGRKPYSRGWMAARTHVQVFAHENLAHALIEIPGQACAAIKREKHTTAILRAAGHRMTRIDIACDIPTLTTPQDFVGCGYNPRFKSHSEFVSESGSTNYVGSRESDRYARVYRYNAPHDRSHLLRCEMVVRGVQAKKAAADLVDVGVKEYAAMIGNSFGWQAPEWDLSELTDEVAATDRPERREGKTLFWLNDTVAPLLVKLAEQGVLDVDDWYRTHVHSKLNPPE